MVEGNGQAGLKPRRLAAETLDGVLRGQGFFPLDTEALPEARERAFANRLVTTALRRNGHLTAIIDTLMRRGLPKRAGRFEAYLRLGLAELLFVEGAAAHAAISSAVTLVKADRRGGHLDKLMNAVLREAQRRAGEFAALPRDLLIPEPFRGRWRAHYGEETLFAFADALVAGAPLDLSFKTEDPDLVAALGARPTLPLSVRLDTRDKKVEDLPGYATGAWWVQDVAASLSARLIDLPAGARVLDLCAAPGGKTAQLAARGYRVTALDNDAGRLERLKANLARLGLAAEIVCADATGPLQFEPFDAILVDAPCSATGTFRRHPEVLINRSPADIADRVDLQRKIVTHAVPLIKPGGTLVFATCSLEPEEGENQAAWISKSFPQLRPAPVTETDMTVLAPALTPNGVFRSHSSLVWPEIGSGGMDGFFLSRFCHTF